MSGNDGATKMLDNIKEHWAAQHNEIEKLRRVLSEAREWLAEARDNAQRLLEAANGWKLAAEEARAECDRLRADAEYWRYVQDRRPTMLIVGFFGNGCVNKTMQDVKDAIDEARKC